MGRGRLWGAEGPAGVADLGGGWPACVLAKALSPWGGRETEGRDKNRQQGKQWAEGVGKTSPMGVCGPAGQRRPLSTGLGLLEVRDFGHTDKGRVQSPDSQV